MLRDQLEKTKKGGSKESAKLKKTSKDLQREITKLKAELDIQRTQNDQYRSRLEELGRQRNTTNTSNLQFANRPSTSQDSAKELNGLIS